MEIDGHSLGAHAAGFTGKKLRRGRIQVIVGLDPSGPGFWFSGPSKRLDRTDANYVEVIHTNAGILGMTTAIGTSDFYVNGGSLQPGCLATPCSHLRSVIYYAEAVVNDNFSSIKCLNVLKARNRACGWYYSGTKLGSSSNFHNANARGVFYTPVNAWYPYGRG